MADHEGSRHRRWWRTGTKGITFATEIPTLFSWVHPADQRERADQLAHLTDQPRSEPGSSDE